SGEDVTEEYVDLESRLNSKEVVEDRLLILSRSSVLSASSIKVNKRSSTTSFEFKRDSKSTYSSVTSSPEVELSKTLLLPSSTVLINDLKSSCGLRAVILPFFEPSSSSSLIFESTIYPSNAVISSSRLLNVCS